MPDYKMANISDNDFAEVTEEMTLENINFPTVEALQTFLSIRNKSSEGDLETLVKRLVLLFFSANIFWFTWNRSMDIFLMSFIYEAAVST